MNYLSIAILFEMLSKLKEYSNEIFSKETLEEFSDLGIEISPIDLVWECSRNKEHFIVTFPNGDDLSVLSNGFEGDEQSFEAFLTKSGDKVNRDNMLNFESLSKLTEKILALANQDKTPEEIFYSSSFKNTWLDSLKMFFRRTGIVLSRYRWFLLDGHKQMYFTVTFSFGDILFVYTTVDGYQAILYKNGEKKRNNKGRRYFFKNIKDLEEHISRLNNIFEEKEFTSTIEIVKDKVFLTVYGGENNRYDCFLDRTGFVKNRSSSAELVFRSPNEINEAVMAFKKQYEV
jgi:hypothetical protein